MLLYVRQKRVIMLSCYQRLSWRHPIMCQCVDWINLLRFWKFCYNWDIQFTSSIQLFCKIEVVWVCATNIVWFIDAPSKLAHTRTYLVFQMGPSSKGQSVYSASIVGCDTSLFKYMLLTEHPFYRTKIQATG